MGVFGSVSLCCGLAREGVIVHHTVDLMGPKTKKSHASNMSKRRKSAGPRQRRGLQEASKKPDIACRTGEDTLRKSQKPKVPQVQHTTHTHGRKTSPADDSGGESSCAVAPLSSMANGGDGPALPTKRKQNLSGTQAAKRAKVEIDGQPSKESPSKDVKQPGDLEDTWSLQIAHKGRITCPKCNTVSRKTVEGIRKHMAICTVDPFSCKDCGKHLKSSTGMKYRNMADHDILSSKGDEEDNQAVKEKLRRVLKRMGKLKCSNERCSGSFTSVMGYLCHMKKCSEEQSRLASPVLDCKHCGKVYKTRAGLVYHIKSVHTPSPLNSDNDERTSPKEPEPERTPSGRVKRISAQVAVFHLQEIASEELLKEWPKRKVQQDLVPDDKMLKYARPGMPAFSQEVLRKWKSEVKLKRKVQCPNQGCEAEYTSVSGLKAHLSLCSRGDFEAGKYKCLICNKEFSSESGVKYHINSIHDQDWFIVTSKACKNFEKLLKSKSRDNFDRTKLDQIPKTLQELKKPLPRPTISPKAKLGILEPKAEEKRGGMRQKDCYDFSGSDSSSTNSSSSSSSDSEGEDEPMPDKWALKQPLAKAEAFKRTKNNA